MTIRFARLNATQPGNQFHEYRIKMLSKFVLNKQIGVKKCNVYHFGMASVLSCFFCSQNTDTYLTIKVERVYVQIFKFFAFMSFQKYCMTMPEIEIHINFALKYTKE